jgi:deazaflavin-dependent oxidoreductase (nitroreductase family)
MPIPRAVARLNRVGLNRLTVHLASWVPGFAIVIHRGRRSGREYRTPVNVFVRDGRHVFALTYGPDSDWVLNVLAAGGCVIEARRRRRPLTAPRRVHDETRHDVPPVPRTVLRLIGVADFLVLDAATPSTAGPGGH